MMRRMAGKGTVETIGNKDIVVTLPQSVKWEEYMLELAAAERGEVMNFKVGNFPQTGVGSKCYICHKGFVVGYMVISGMSEKDFTCSTTGKKWSGKFIERSGKFIYLEKPIPMKGFQGFHYFKEIDA